jgi:3-dehydroquinate synthase
MTTVELTFATETCPYYAGEGLLAEVADLLGPLTDGGQAFVVSDETVGPMYGIDIAEKLDAPLLQLPTGEEQKCWSSVERVVRFLVANQVERGSLLVAVGGGVVTDIGGFAAAVALRGIRWAAIPTTLLGMVDAAVGGKTGIDLDVGKNLVGSFWPPRAVLADPLVLATLDPRQVRSGLSEVIKSAMIAPSALEHLLDAHLASVAGGDPLQALELIVGCVRVKGDVVSVDEREAGPRRALNLGHTLAHALEAATDYQYFLHGEAVAWGLLAELRLARDRGLVSTAEAVTWAERLQTVAPLPDLGRLPWQAVAPFVGRDKKRRGGRVGWVLPRMGGVVIDVPIAEAEAAAVYAALRRLPAGGPLTGLF